MDANEVKSELHEGPEAYKRFDAMMTGVLKVPRAVIQARVQEEKERAAKNPNRRGPKSKSKPPR